MSSRPRTFGELEPSNWPGERLGIPERGPGSIARVGRRVLALVIDYAIASLLAFWIVGDWQSGTTNLWIFGLFAVCQIVFIPTIGGSVGHRLLGLNVLALDGSWIGFRRTLIRTVLLLLVIPALVWDSDQRGFHDKVAGTVLLRRAR